jgi:hypothetical protein
MAPALPVNSTLLFAVVDCNSLAVVVQRRQFLSVASVVDDNFFRSSWCAATLVDSTRDEVPRARLFTTHLPILKETTAKSEYYDRHNVQARLIDLLISA